MKHDIHHTIPIPSGITVTVTPQNTLRIAGPQGDVTRPFYDPKITITAGTDCIELHAPAGSRKEKKRLFSYSSHIINMIKGVQTRHEYLLKICSGHFPMNISATPTQFSIKNFLGEKIPRTIPLPNGVTVKVEGDTIRISSPDLELAGQTASRMEHLTRITNRDLRIFQDGVYIISKPE